MVTHVQRGGISEFVRLVGETFSTDLGAAEAATRQMLMRLLETPYDPGVQCLFDNVPGARDLVFAEMLRHATDDTSLSPDRETSAELFALFLSYCSAHAGVDCASRILATTHLRVLQHE